LFLQRREQYRPGVKLLIGRNATPQVSQFLRAIGFSSFFARARVTAPQQSVEHNVREWGTPNIEPPQAAHTRGPIPTLAFIPFFAQDRLQNHSVLPLRTSFAAS
jgi:hypothetical protein